MIQSIENIFHAFQSLISHIGHGLPARNISLIGVTGTDGKTTTVHLIREILKSSGFKVASVSSIEARIGNRVIDTGFHVTTPDPWVVPQLIRQAVNCGCSHMVIEASSHGLDQNRLFACHFAVGVFTNISHEHLDYHRTFDNYLKAKVKLLQMSDIAVINADDKIFNVIRGNLQKEKRILTFAINKKADITPATFPFATKLPGEYNIYNCLAAIAAAKALDLADQPIRKAVATFRSLPGRFEMIPNKRGINLIIDFAHKPNAMENVLQHVKKTFPRGRIIIVFGAAGERDKLKRPMMGKIASYYADISVLTAEDPRGEAVDEIIDAIAKGCKEGGAYEVFFQNSDITMPRNKQKKSFVRIPDRQQAINFATQIAKRGDSVLLLGKGHEKSMCYSNTEYPWSEHEAVKISLAK